MARRAERLIRTMAALAAGLGTALMIWTPICQADTPTGGPDGSAIVISPGEHIVLKLDPSAAPAIVSRGPIPAGETTPRPPTRSYETLQPATGAGAPPKSQEFSLSLSSDLSGGTILKASNGYLYPVLYSAWLVVERNGQRTYHRTSICPVLPGKVGFESWQGTVVGIAIKDVAGVDPQHMSCNGGSSLSAAAPGGQASDRFVCVGGDTPDHRSPLTVSILADGGGGVSLEKATWMQHQGSGANSMFLRLDYAILDSHVLDHPADMRVIAIVGVTPPPKAKAVDLVLMQNGVEKLRRPWRLYAQSMASILNAPKPPVAIVGMIPFPSENDPAVKALLATIGSPGSSIAIRLAGDDGEVLGEYTFDTQTPPTRSNAAVAAALDEALGKAKTPASCQKLKN